MNKIRVVHLGGIDDIEDVQALDALLRARQGPNQLNAFLISGSDPYPMLSLLVRGNLCYAHYFPADGKAGFQSIGDALQGAQDTVTFVQHPASEEIDVPAASVVSFDQALLAAHEFAETLSLPRSLRWLEL